MLLLCCAVSLVVAVARATPLDEYVSAVDPHYGWTDTGHRFKTTLGGTGYVLNVTSQKWLDISRAAGPGNTSLWTHQVVVVVPKKLRYTNVSMVYLTGSCNKDGPIAPPKASDEDILVVDEVSPAPANFSPLLGAAGLASIGPLGAR